jgi:hypothetical protein
MMKKLTLKDAHYHIIGYVEVKDNGDKTLKDEHYRVVAHGDILTSLLNK